MNHTCTAPIEENDLRLLLIILRVTVKWETAKASIFRIITWKWHQNGEKIGSGNPTFFRCITWNPLYLFSISWHYPFNKFSYNFRSKSARSTLTPPGLIRVNKGNFCIGIFLNLRKAFDTVSHDILIKKLCNLGVKNTELEWWKSFPNTGTQKVNGHLSDLLNLTCGVFQYNILGPLLFLYYNNDIFNATNLATFI